MAGVVPTWYGSADDSVRTVVLKSSGLGMCVSVDSGADISEDVTERWAMYAE